MLKLRISVVSLCFTNCNEKLLIDWCHSEQSAKNLASYLKTLNEDIYGIWGMQDHKQPEIFIKQFEGLFKKIITVDIDNELKINNREKLKSIAIKNNIKSETSPNFKAALKILSTKKKKVITIFGSLYLIGQVLNLN